MFFFVLIIFFFLPLYTRSPKDWKYILVFSFVLSTVLTIFIWFRNISTDYVINCLLTPGNGYLLFT